MQDEKSRIAAAAANLFKPRNRTGDEKMSNIRASIKGSK
jgi:hypothetical protein